MEHSEEKKPFLACLMAVGLLLGGCAFHGQRATPEQAGDNKPNIPTQAQTAMPSAAPEEPVLDGSEIVFTPPSVELTDQTWPQEPDPFDHPVAYCLLEKEDERAQTRQWETDTSDPSQTNNLATTEDEASLEYEDAETSESFAGSDPHFGSAHLGNEDSDLLDRIRQGFALPKRHHRRIDSEAKWFNQAYLDRVADQARPYLHYIVSQVEKRGLPTEIVLLPVVESAFQPYA